MPCCLSSEMFRVCARQQSRLVKGNAQALARVIGGLPRVHSRTRRTGKPQPTDRQRLKHMC